MEASFTQASGFPEAENKVNRFGFGQDASRPPASPRRGRGDARTTSFMIRRLRAIAAACPRSQLSGDTRSPTVDDEDLQDEPLQITVLDHDTYSANDAIGKVYIDIDPLLYSEAATVISGWFPIYDTIHGIRGEINVVVKVDLFNDLNRFRQSSCGVKFFCSKMPFNEDPNPNPHSSGPSTPLKNQTYSFSPSKSYSRQSSSSDTDLSLTPKTAPYSQGPGIYLCPSSTPLSCGSLHLKSRLLSESSLTPHHSSLVSPVLRKSVSFSEELFLAASGMGSGSAGKEGGPFKALLRQQTQSALEQREFPFLTLTAFPPGLLVHVGGVVSARSVKLLDRIHNP
ncbi:hypothetical protein A6R68_17547, partial [Neotoma lepida]